MPGATPCAAIDLQRFPDARSAAAALAASVAGSLRAGIAARGAASLVVSGGRSPVAFFAALRVQPLPWTAVHVTLADERWVAPQAADSNERLLREHLLCDAAAGARFVGLWNPAATPAAGRVASRAALAPLPRPFDAVVLGMGADGHTASLFPGMPGLAAALDPDGEPDLVAAQAPAPPTARISLNLAALLDSHRLFLPIQGAAKRAVFQAACSTARPTGGAGYPVAALFRQQRVPLQIQLIDE